MRQVIPMFKVSLIIRNISDSKLTIGMRSERISKFTGGINTYQFTSNIYDRLVWRNRDQLRQLYDRYVFPGKKTAPDWMNDNLFSFTSWSDPGSFWITSMNTFYLVPIVKKNNANLNRHGLARLLIFYVKNFIKKMFLLNDDL